MNSHKYACPSCGQNLEYSDEYSGKQMPCPACHHDLRFPGLAPVAMQSSLRLARDIPQPGRKPRLNFFAMLGWLRYFINQKAVAICLLSVLFIGGGLLASSRVLHHPAPPVVARAVVDESIPADPPDPPPADPSNSVPVDSVPETVASVPSEPSQPPPAGRRGARGGRGGRQGGARGGARGRGTQKARTPTAANGGGN